MELLHRAPSPKLNGSWFNGLLGEVRVEQTTVSDVGLSLEATSPSFSW